MVNTVVKKRRKKKVKSEICCANLKSMRRVEESVLFSPADLTLVDSVSVQRSGFTVVGNTDVLSSLNAHRHTHKHRDHIHSCTPTQTHTPSHSISHTHTQAHTCEVKEAFDLRCCYTDLCRILPQLSCVSFFFFFVHVCVHVCVAWHNCSVKYMWVL